MHLSWSRGFRRAAILAAALVVSGCATKPLPAGDGQWRTYQGDFARTNLSAGSITLPMSVAWGKDISEFTLLRGHPEEHLSAPAIAQGTLYAGSANGRLYAADLATGKVRWSFDAAEPIEAPPTVTDDMVCFGTSGGVMRCLDLKGRLLWQFKARSEILSSPVVGASRVFFSSSDDRLYALDAATGERVWTYSRATYKTVTPRLYASPALSAKRRIMSLFSDGTLACLSAETGKEVWTRKTVKEFDARLAPRRTPLSEGGAVYVIDSSDALLALSEETGEIRSIFSTIKAKDFVMPDERTIVIAGETEVISMDRASGAVHWRRALEHGPVSSVFSSGGYLFVLSNFTRTTFGIKYLAKDKGHIEAIGLSDGKSAWSRTLNATLAADASSAYERVALISNDGVLTVLEPR